MMLHALFEALGYATGLLVYLSLRARFGDTVPEATRWTVIAAAALGAVIGGKALYWAEDPARIAAHWRDPGVLLGGKTVVGGLIGGLAAVEVSKRYIGERRATGDLFALPVCAGLAVGRVGCLMAGPGDHTWGRATTSALGIDGGDGVLRHCLPLYEIAFLGAFGLVLLALSPRLPRAGDLFRVFMIGYLVFRFALETLKDDVGFGGLTIIQWAAVATLVYYAKDVARLAAEMRLGG